MQFFGAVVLTGNPSSYDRRFYAAERRFYLAVEPALRSLLSNLGLNLA